jgi:tetratricopeptide (TPR) repeat protein
LIPLAILIAALAGYAAGSNLGRSNHQDAIRNTATEQYELALEDLEAGRFEIAKERLEYIARIDPSYPGVTEHLAEAYYLLNAPTSTPLVKSTPTPNLAPIEDLFEQAQEAFRNGDWTTTIETLIALRAEKPAYRAIEVDKLLFASLRNRGIARIEQEGHLEEGLYDLSRAERFGPLDRDADTWRSWAQLYLLANSYMGVDWPQAAYYFEQLYQMVPYLKGDTYLKFARAAHAYGDQLYAADDPCSAQDQYAQSLAAWEDSSLLPTATKAASACQTATAPPPPPPQDTSTPTGTPEESDVTPTPTLTPTPES